jgi:hypothetical protein
MTTRECDIDEELDAEMERYTRKVKISIFGLLSKIRWNIINLDSKGP